MKVELKTPVSIRTQFVFNAGDPWANAAEFEKDLVDFLNSKNMIGESVNTLNTNELLVFVSQKPIAEPLTNADVPADAPVKQVRKLFMVNKKKNG